MWAIYACITSWKMNLIVHATERTKDGREEQEEQETHSLKKKLREKGY